MHLHQAYMQSTHLWSTNPLLCTGWFSEQANIWQRACL